MKPFLFTIACALALSSCHDKKIMESEIDGTVYYRDEMRQFVIGLSDYARNYDSNFIVIPQNGQALVRENDNIASPLQTNYLAAINGQGREDLFFGYNNDDEETPQEERELWMPALELLRDEGKTVLVTDYCSTPSHMDQSYALNQEEDFVSFAADSRDLNQIPAYPTPIYGENNLVIQNLSEVQNFLYLIDTQDFLTKQDFIDAVVATNYDLIIMDAFFEDEPYTFTEIEQLRHKANGGYRLVVAYMSIGEAEDYRYYWQNTWSFNSPEWMGSVNPDWPGNYKIDYWNPEWQKIIYGDENSYLHKILSAGFDGTYLDLIDAYEYMEETN
jgi:cysteinyl-tRNA synthetase, unknown class